MSVHECEGCITVYFVYANKIAHSILFVLLLSVVVFNVVAAVAAALPML